MCLHYIAYEKDFTTVMLKFILHYNYNHVVIYERVVKDLYLRVVYLDKLPFCSSHV